MIVKKTLKTNFLYRLMAAVRKLPAEIWIIFKSVFAVPLQETNKEIASKQAAENSRFIFFIQAFNVKHFKNFNFIWIKTNYI